MNPHAETETRLIEKTDPATGEIIAHYPVADRQAVEATVSKSRAAQPDWANMPLKARANVLKAMAERLYAQADEAAATVSRETGKPFSDALQAEVATAVNVLNYYADLGPRLLKPQKVKPDRVSILSGRSHEEVRSPHGVVAVVTPWNYPLAITVSGLAAALMAGNTVVLKPSELSPGTGQFIVDLFRQVLSEAGKNPDAIQCVQGDGTTGAALMDADIDAAIFTGSSRVGHEVQSKLLARGKFVSLELGGSDPMIVLPDASDKALEAAASYAVWGRFVNAGQACAAVKRLYVPQDKLETFTRLLKERTEALRVGGSGEPGSHVGPLISEKQRQTLDEQVKDAITRGASVLAGGGPVAGPGYFYRPTLLTNVPPEARVLTEEVFGPALPVIAYRNLDEAVTMANDTPYGLTASVFGPPDQARGVADRLECGTVVINDVGTSNYAMLSAGWSGWKNSGSGTSHGHQALLEMTRSKIVSRNRLFGLPAFGKPLWHFSRPVPEEQESKAIMNLAVGRRLWHPATWLAVWKNRAGTKL